MSVSTTRTVNSPCSRTVRASHSSNSVGSEIDNRHLLEILVEQRVERLCVVVLLEPGLERLQRWRHVGRLLVLLGMQPLPDRTPDRLEPRQDLVVRLADGSPA